MLSASLTVWYHVNSGNLKRYVSGTNGLVRDRDRYGTGKGTRKGLGLRVYPGLPPKRFYPVLGGLPPV